MIPTRVLADAIRLLEKTWVGASDTDTLIHVISEFHKELAIRSKK
jgi:hypothetical protein